MKKISISIFIVLAFSYCRNTPSTKPADVAQPSNKTGKELAQIYCGNCHQYPDPSLLDKTTWTKELLPNMGARLGIKTGDYDPLQKIKGLDKMMIQTENIYPNTPLINQTDWNKIVAFYQNEAPEKLTLSEKKEVIGILKGFEIKQQTDIKQFPPVITLSKIDEQEKKLYLGTLDGKLTVFQLKDNRVAINNFYSLLSAPVSLMHPDTENILILGIGQIHPNEQQEGQVAQIGKSSNALSPQLNMLKRPVHFASSDNGKTDMLICEYGYQKGQLSYYKKINKKWQGQILSDTAGATKALPYDFNKDGLMDFAVLMAQGDERINIYYAQKTGSFQAKQVLQFPPVYGSSDLQLVDFNKDGAIDLLYTNGDNEDLSPVLKPFHGVRVFLNDGKDNFKENLFYPMYGAFQAKAADFDLDGDMDIAVVSFFPEDKTKPESHFLYLEQTRPNQFKPYTFKEASQGRWMTLDVGDADGDGDADILLSSFIISLAGNSKKVEKNDKILPFVFLENKRR